mgnify:CR=1 FL=1
MKKLKQFIIKNKQVKGFTLVEMVIVIAIIAMLILLIVPGLSKQKDRATSKTDEALRTTIETQRQLAEDNGDGTSLEELVKKEYISQKQNAYQCCTKQFVPLSTHLCFLLIIFL